MRISDWSSDVCSSDLPENDSMAAAFLLRAADALLARLEGDWPEREGAWDSAQALLRARWPWAQPVLERLKKPNKPERWLFSRLPEWEEGPPHPPTSTVARPDEHTSELKSQIRTTHASFCTHAKNKNKKK